MNREEIYKNLLRIIHNEQSTDKQIIAAKENILKMMKVLVESIVNQWTTIDRNSYMSAALYGLMTAIQSYDITKVKQCKFSSWACTYIKKALQIEKTYQFPVQISFSTLQKDNKKYITEDINNFSVEYYDNTIAENMDFIDIYEFFAFEIDKLTEKQFDSLKYTSPNTNRSLKKEILSKWNWSRSAVIQFSNNIQKNLKAKYETRS